MAKKKLTKEDYKKGFQIIFSYLKEHKRELVLLSCVSVIIAIMNTLSPYVLGKFYDALTKGGTITLFSRTVLSIFVFLASWVCIQLTQYLLDSFLNYRKGILGVKLFNTYVLRAWHHIMMLPLSFHKKKKISVVIETVHKSANALEQISSVVLIYLAPQFLTIFLALGFSLYLNYTLALIMIGGVSIYCLILFKTIHNGAEIQRKMQQSWQNASRVARDAADNIVTIKQAVSEEYQNKLNIKKYAAAYMYDVLYGKLWAKISLYQKLTILLTQGLVLGFGITYISTGKLSVGQLIAFISYVGLLFGPFLTLGDWWKTVQNGFISLEISEKNLAMPTEIYRPRNYVQLNKINGHVAFEGVSFSYEKKQAVLSDINFEVKAGEVIALVGKSGEGKSTLIDLVSGYHFADTGRVLIDGHNIKKLDLGFLRSHIAIVPQEVVLFNDTIEQNIKYGSFNATHEQVILAAEKAFATEFIEKFPKKWKQMVGERGFKLSVGQKQRVAIARAILRNPEILILDEPTSALDAHSEHHITRALDELMKGRTTFIIAHRLSTVRRADKIVVFKEGRIAEIGTHEELMQKENGEYRHLYDLQQGLHN